MRSKYSGKHFVRAYPCGVNRPFLMPPAGFQFFGGILPVLIYDNLTTAGEKFYKVKKGLANVFSQIQCVP
jgi:hypothetical protein